MCNFSTWHQNITLIIIDQVLRTTLFVYMEHPNHPLPSLEEVLVCNLSTTDEEVLTSLCTSPELVATY